ncbi:tetrapyrrole biosynthesis, uroporphyrinogen III synthase [Aspergillus taichungensis]|uniref:Tetrapyrrole biosynthesis, uroporphyrinogen III synthase n=1 Tax=Aspergillus taichungensis TaxID=482145 RepID=A0A2J5HJR9_9EURO|nr:tetrapyrrole biosynthesis, uroporphyrinogen III synthase [Aspergillus taichungensis]
MTPPKYPFAKEHPTNPPILLLKTRSSPKDTYAEYFSARGYNPAFVPVLEHRFRGESLSRLRGLLEGGRFTTAGDYKNNGTGNGGEDKYGGLIFTSQRAVEAFGAVLEGVEETTLASSFSPPPNPNSTSNNPAHSLPIYTVGPATSRAVSALKDTYLPNASVHGEHSGTGDVLAGYILEHYNGLYRNNHQGNHQEGKNTDKPPLLFLVGEQRRDIIPKTLTGGDTPAETRIGVEEMVVYETGVMGSFEDDFTRAVAGGEEWLSLRKASGLDNADEREKSVWVVVFSPTGCDAMIRVLDLGTTGESGRRRKEGFFIATIGPTTRDHLWNKYGVEADVCAERPSEEGVYEGIERFMRDRASS